jgi:hypothetical protein
MVLEYLHYANILQLPMPVEYECGSSFLPDITTTAEARPPCQRAMTYIVSCHIVGRFSTVVFVGFTKLHFQP